MKSNLSDVSAPNSVHVFILGFLLLAAMNATQVSAPPYWDAIPYYSQGIWLHHNDLDVAGLWSQPRYVQGGPLLARAYTISSVLFAIAIASLPVKLVYSILHILTWFAGAFVFAGAWHLAKKLMPWHLALMWCGVGLLEPIFNGQTAAIYLEVPIAACVVAIALLLSRGKIWLAMVVCVLTLAVKPTAMLASLALVCVAIADTIVAARRVEPGAWRRSLPLVLTPLVVISAFTLLDAVEGAPRLWRQDHHLLFLELTLTIFPVWLPLTMTAALVACVMGLGRRWSGDSRRAMVFVASLVCGFWISYVFFVDSLPRYAAGFSMAAAVVTGVVVTSLFRRASGPLAAALGILFLINQAGIGILEGYRNPRSGENLERSRLFTLDNQANAALCDFLDDDPTRPVVAKYPYTLQFRAPELGCVSQPIETVYGGGIRFFGVLPLYGDRPLPPDTVFVYVNNVFEHAIPPTLRPPEGAEILWEDHSGTNIWVYRP